MSQSSNTQQEPRGINTQQPAFGIIATGENDDEIARVVLRARANGHQVVMTNPEGAAPEIPELANLDGIQFIPPDEGELSADREAARTRLKAAGKAISPSGLVIVDDTSHPVDFEASIEAVDDQSVGAAVYADRPSDIKTMVAIPAYNEAATIQSVVEAALTFADEVVVVDDGSTDQTASLAREAGATVVSHGRNRGYGAALSSAFETAAGRGVERLVIIDGDDQHDPADIPVLAEAVVDEETNVAIGSRFKGDASSEIPLYRRFGLGVINVLTNISMGSFNPKSWIKDTQSGFRAYDEHAIEVLADADIGDDMDASLDILYHINSEGLHIEEFPTVVDYEIENGHSQNPVSQGLGLVSTILQTIEREHPVLLLGVPGFLITFIGLVLGYMTVANYVTTQTFPIGLALSSAFSILLGVFSGFTAIVLHSLQAHLGR